MGLTVNLSSTLKNASPPHLTLAHLSCLTKGSCIKDDKHETHWPRAAAPFCQMGQLVRGLLLATMSCATLNAMCLTVFRQRTQSGD